MARLDGKIAIVTGAARGMGLAEAQLFSAEGARVVLADVLDADGTLAAKELGADAVYMNLDVTCEADWRHVLAETQRVFGVPDVLVNNAGILRYGPITQMSQLEFESVLAVNLVGPFLGMKVVGAAMAVAGRGSIVNVSSIGGMIGYSQLGAYVASKWGLRGLTKTAALELGRSGVRVNSLHPGGVDTPMTNAAGGPVDQSPYAGQPIPRIGRPEEIANLALFLASDESSYSTGSEFVADGGVTAGQSLG